MTLVEYSLGMLGGQGSSSGTTSQFLGGDRVNLTPGLCRQFTEVLSFELIPHSWPQDEGLVITLTPLGLLGPSPSL